jgi:hypothetical protein
MKVIYKSKTNKSGIRKSRILLIDAIRLLKSLSYDKRFQLTRQLFGLLVFNCNSDRV